MREEVWVEKYNPNDKEELILTKEIDYWLNNLLENDNIPNMTLWSTMPGTGKTTTAKFLIDHLDREFLFINGSKENGIDTLRNKMENFAMTSSIDGKKKVILIDEADALAKNSMQPALRGFIEQYMSTCSFILTCNYVENIIDPILSRCPVVDFNYDNEEKQTLAKQIQQRLFHILDKEYVSYEKRAVTKILIDNFPDIRKTINILQRQYQTYNRINLEDKLDEQTDLDILLELIISQNYKEIKEWVRNNHYNPKIYKMLYDKLYENCGNGLKIELILILSKYENRGCIGDREISLLACLTEIFNKWER